ncbi:MAG: hypothetical protein ABI599_02085 [Flavobacteriales bacterium]
MNDEALNTLSTVDVDSISVTTHPQGAAAEKRIMLRFSERNKRWIMDRWACLKEELHGPKGSIQGLPAFDRAWVGIRQRTAHARMH